MIQETCPGFALANRGSYFSFWIKVKTSLRSYVIFKRLSVANISMLFFIWVSMLQDFGLFSLKYFLMQNKKHWSEFLYWKVNIEKLILM